MWTLTHGEKVLKFIKFWNIFESLEILSQQTDYQSPWETLLLCLMKIHSSSLVDIMEIIWEMSINTTPVAMSGSSWLPNWSYQGIVTLPCWCNSRCSNNVTEVHSCCWFNEYMCNNFHNTVHRDYRMRIHTRTYCKHTLAILSTSQSGLQKLRILRTHPY